MAANLNQLAHAANIGALDCDEQVRDELIAACADIKALRQMLVAALGLKGRKPAASLPKPRRAFSLVAEGGEQP